MPNLGKSVYTVTMDTSKFDADIKRLEREVQTFDRSLDQEFSKAGMSGARGLLQISYAVDDLQYGFRSIVNNIPQIALAIGGKEAASIAGAAGIAAVAINLLIQHWGELTSVLQSAWSGSAIDQLEAIRKKAEEARKAWEGIPGQTAAQQKEAKGIVGMVQEGPKERIREKLLEAIQANPAMMVEMSDAEKHVLSRQRGRAAVGGEEAQKRLADLEREIFEAMIVRAREKAEMLIGESALVGPAGDEARNRLGMLMPSMKSEIEAQSPEGQKRQKDFEKKIDTDKKVQDKIKQANEEQFKAMKERATAEAHGAKVRDDEAKEFKERGETERAEWLKEIGEIQKDRHRKDRESRIFNLEDQRAALMEARHKEQEHIRKAGHDISIGGSAKDYVQSVQQSALDMIPKQQLDKLKAIDEGIKNVNETLKKEHRGAKFG